MGDTDAQDVLLVDLPPAAEFTYQVFQCLGMNRGFDCVAAVVRDMEGRARKLRQAIRDTIVAGDRVTPDLGGHGDTVSITDAIVERLKG